MIKENINRGRTFGVAIGITILILMLVMPVDAASGYMVWEQGMPTTYTWDSHSFAGFYYNLDENLGTEELTIRDIISNEKAEIRVNITNIGTKAATLPVGLIINSTEVDSIPVDIAAGEVKDVTFNKEVALPPGNYTIEVLGQKKLVEVREAPFNVFLALGAMIAIGGVVIYLLTAKGKFSLKMLQKQPQEGEIKNSEITNSELKNSEIWGKKIMK